MSSKKGIVLFLLLLLLAAIAVPALAEAVAPEAAVPAEAVVSEAPVEEAAEYQSRFFATFWSLLPPIIAIALALITKEVYTSLFVGIIAGALLYANFNPVLTVTSIFTTMTGKLGDGWNVGILIFLVILGIMVSLMTRAGGSAAYGKWASGAIKSRRGALLATTGLGALIFVDDYFNCLTVGSVMRPVTDKFKISRAKLAYLIDATAAPICIIAPISSWAAAVTSSTEGFSIDGFVVFLRAIPYNYYAILTIVMMIALAIMRLDYGPMKKCEDNAENTGDLFSTDDRPFEDEKSIEVSPKGRVFDLVIPVVLLIVLCVVGMIYTGGFFEGVSFVDAFAGCDASVGLVLGSFCALILTLLLYLPRGVVTFKQFSQCITEGFHQMVAPILILTFAWTLSGFCRDGLGAGDFVGTLVSGNAAVSAMLPCLIFVIAVGLSFATGTSWGTFGILIPIVLSIMPTIDSEIMLITISACLAGAVCGDHCSPISDTTIMASTGAQCSHIQHVSTQLPYALTVAAVSFVAYIIAGILQNVVISLIIAVALMLGVLFILRKKQRRA